MAKGRGLPYYAFLLSWDVFFAKTFKFIWLKWLMGKVGSVYFFMDVPPGLAFIYCNNCKNYCLKLEFRFIFSIYMDETDFLITSLAKHFSLVSQFVA